MTIPSAKNWLLLHVISIVKNQASEVADSLLFTLLVFNDKRLYCHEAAENAAASLIVKGKK